MTNALIGNTINVVENDETIEFLFDDNTTFCNTTLCNLSAYGYIVQFLSYVKEENYQTFIEFKVETER